MLSGKCNGRSGWFDKDHVLLVMSEAEQKAFSALTDQEDTSHQQSGIVPTIGVGAEGGIPDFEVKVSYWLVSPVEKCAWKSAPIKAFFQAWCLV